MPSHHQRPVEPSAVAAAISRTLRRSDRTASVAESLTSGRIASYLGAAEAASDWFCGGVVAYTNDVKYKVLDVDQGPVVTASCARQMAHGVANLTGSDFAISVTGVGGPDPVEGQPAGTVFIAVRSADSASVEEHHFGGDIEDVLHAATARALQMLLDEAERQAGRS
jgi:nicotinamide-nucleotide amidase